MVRTLSVKRLGSRALSRALRLPPPTTDFTVQHGLPVPMRDGVDLLADHYTPGKPRP